MTDTETEQPTLRSDCRVSRHQEALRTASRRNQQDFVFQDWQDRLRPSRPILEPLSVSRRANDLKDEAPDRRRPASASGGDVPADEAERPPITNPQRS